MSRQPDGDGGAGGNRPDAASASVARRPVPGIDSEVGMLCYSTGFAGCGGSIKKSPQDFEVTEIISDGARSLIGDDAGAYPVYVLTKTGIDTNHALSWAYRDTGLRLRSMGLKDANAVTTQYVYCTAKRGADAPGAFEAKRYSLRRLGYTKKPLSRRHMTGNRFAVRISGSSSGAGAFDEHGRILNFYGHQRFGSARPVTHLVGKALVQQRYDDAVDYVLSHASEYDTPERAEVRALMADRSRLAQVYDNIPAGMDLERRLVSELVRHNDAPRAIRALPVDMRRFYVQAYQSYLFNLTVSRAFGDGDDLFAPREGDVCYGGDGVLGKYAGASGGGGGQRLAVPTVGYSYYKKTRFDPHVSAVLRGEGVAPRDFYIKAMQEASAAGGFRNAAVGVDGFEACGDRVSFTLSRGSFATVVLREIIKPTDPIACGF